MQWCIVWLGRSGRNACVGADGAAQSQAKDGADVAVEGSLAGANRGPHSDDEGDDESDSTVWTMLRDPAAPRAPSSGRGLSSQLSGVEQPVMLINGMLRAELREVG